MLNIKRQIERKRKQHKLRKAKKERKKLSEKFNKNERKIKEGGIETKWKQQER